MKTRCIGHVSYRATAGALAGLIGGLAHAAVNERDRKILQHNADDLILLGGVFTANPATARRIGIGMHLTFAALFGSLYGVVFHPKDQTDALRKGVGFAVGEHLTLFPLGIIVDAYHPRVMDGTIDRFWHPRSFAQASLRHIALGIGMGASYPFVHRLIGT